MDCEAIPWRETRHPGVAIHFYATERDGDCVVAAIRMAPGCGYPAHRHRGPEVVLVLAGGYRDEFGTHRAGAFVRYEAGSAHTPVAEAGADCVLLATAHGGVTLE